MSQPQTPQTSQTQQQTQSRKKGYTLAEAHMLYMQQKEQARG